MLKINNKEILGMLPLKSQRRKLESLLSQKGYTPSDIRNALRIHKAVVISDSKIEFWDVRGLSLAMSDYQFIVLDKILSGEQTDSEKECILQDRLGYRVPIHVDSVQHVVEFSRF